MKVLVFGAGIIGSYLTHILCLAGNEVTLLARGSWKDTLEENGLRIHHVIQGRTTIDHPRIIESIDPEEYYNAIFVAMPCSEVVNVLDAIAGANTPIVVMVGNTLQSKEMSSYIRRNSPVKKVVLSSCSDSRRPAEARSMITWNASGWALRAWRSGSWTALRPTS